MAATLQIAGQSLYVDLATANILIKGTRAGKYDFHKTC